MLLEKAYKRTIKEQMKVFVPIFVSLLGFSLIALGDNTMVSWLEEEDAYKHALSATVLVNRTCSIPLFFCIGFSHIVTIFTISAKVKQNYYKATEGLKSALLLCGGLGIIIGLSFAYCPSLLIYCKITQDAELFALCKQYTPFLALSIIPAIFSECIRKYLQGLGWLKTNMVLIIVGGLLNLCLNYIFMYGKFGLPAMKIRGLALATLISRLIVFLVYLYLIHLAKKQGHCTLSASSLLQLDHKILKRVLILGLPIGLGLMLRQAYLRLALMVLIGRIDKTALEAITRMIVVLAPLRMLPIANGIASSMLISKAWKKRDKRQQHIIGVVGYTSIFIIASTLCVVFYFCLPYLDTVLPDPQGAAHLSIATKFIGILSLTFLLESLSFQGENLLNGIKDSFFPFIMGIIYYWGVGFFLSYLLSHYWQYGTYGVFTGFIVSLIAINITFLKRFFQQIKTPSQPARLRTTINAAVNTKVA
ncbi:MAG: MATE family efflux transporter [Bacteroidota bacterium]